MSLPTYEYVEVERQDSIVILKANRPDALNALNPTLLTNIRDAVTMLTEDATIDVLVITGNGRAFVAGADIKSMVDYTSEQAKEYGQLGHQAFNAVANFPAPTIAAVNGFALGGGLELALSCDLIYASTKAKFGIPEVGLGVIPGWGGTQRLARLTSNHVARELLFTGKMITSSDALRIGLALAVFEQDEFLDDVLDIAKEIASKGPLALRAAKRAFSQGIEKTLQEGLEIESTEFANLFGTNDQKEGMTAFIEKRTPNFSRT